MITEGKITVDLGPNGAVQLVSNRTAAVADLLIGRRPDEAIDMLPMVFSLCAKAHVSAARSALGLVWQPQDTRVVLAENAREHLLRILLGWKPEGAATQMPSATVMRLVDDTETLPTLKVAEALDDYLTCHIFGVSPKEFLEIETLRTLGDWFGAALTAPQRFLALLVLDNWQALGAISPNFLPDLTLHPLLGRLSNPGFTLAPDWLGAPCETGPLARQFQTPLINEAVEMFGAGLLARLLARLVELANIPTAMRARLDEPDKTSGIGAVETARGRLVHICRLSEGRIADYAILAPTDWNFHPQGVAAQSLAQLQAPDKTALARQARAVLEAIDPCVRFEVRVA